MLGIHFLKSLKARKKIKNINRIHQHCLQTGKSPIKVNESFACPGTSTTAQNSNSFLKHLCFLLPQKYTAFISLNSGSYSTKSTSCSLSHIPFTFSDLSQNFNFLNQFEKSKFILSQEPIKYKVVLLTEKIIHLAKRKLLQKLFQFFH